MYPPDSCTPTLHPRYTLAFMILYLQYLVFMPYLVAPLQKSIPFMSVYSTFEVQCEGVRSSVCSFSILSVNISLH